MVSDADNYKKCIILCSNIPLYVSSKLWSIDNPSDDKTYDGLVNDVRNDVNIDDYMSLYVLGYVFNGILASRIIDDLKLHASAKFYEQSKCVSTKILKCDDYKKMVLYKYVIDNTGPDGRVTAGKLGSDEIAITGKFDPDRKTERLVAGGGLSGILKILLIFIFIIIICASIILYMRHTEYYVDEQHTPRRW